MERKIHGFLTSTCDIYFESQCYPIQPYISLSTYIGKLNKHSLSSSSSSWYYFVFEWECILRNNTKIECKHSLILKILLFKIDQLLIMVMVKILIIKTRLNTEQQKYFYSINVKMLIEKLESSIIRVFIILFLESMSNTLKLFIFTPNALTLKYFQKFSYLIWTFLWVKKTITEKFISGILGISNVFASLKAAIKKLWSLMSLQNIKEPKNNLTNNKVTLTSMIASLFF